MTGINGIHCLCLVTVGPFRILVLCMPLPLMPPCNPVLLLSHPSKSTQSIKSQTREETTQEDNDDGHKDMTGEEECQAGRRQQGATIPKGRRTNDDLPFNIWCLLVLRLRLLLLINDIV